MKFNIDAFKRFNKYVNTEEKVGLESFLIFLVADTLKWSSRSQICLSLFWHLSFRCSWLRSTALWWTLTCWCDVSSCLWTALRARPKTWKVWRKWLNDLMERWMKDKTVLNMFLCLFFSVVEVFSECRLLSYMAQVENRLFFLFRLISIINVQTLTQASYTFYFYARGRQPMVMYVCMVYVFNLAPRSCTPIYILW